MPRVDSTSAALDVAGMLSVVADDVPLSVEFLGDAIAVVLSDLRSAVRLRSKLKVDARRRAFRNLQRLLARSGLEIRVMVRNHCVARLTAGGRRAPLAAWLGVDPLELRPRAILAALVDRGGGPGRIPR